MENLLFENWLTELQAQFYSMIKAAQSKICLKILFIVLLGFIQNSGVAQSHERVAQTDLSRLLDQASKRVEEYRTLFKELTAEETKTTEVFNRRGEVTEKKVVLSDFFLYQSRFNDQAVYEYRPARTVNGKPVANREENVQKLFNKLAKADTAEKERKILHEENLKSHLRYWYYQLTLDPVSALREWSQGLYDFGVIGREEIERRETLIISYRRKDASLLNPRDFIEKNMSRGFKSGLARKRGRFWLDAETARMLRHERESTLEFAGEKEPLVAIRELYDFAPSSYEIFVPKRIVVDIFFDSWREKDGARRLSRDCRITYEYGPFQRFSVTSKEEEKKIITGGEKTPQRN